MAASKRTAEGDDERSDEAWIRTGDSELSIRIRSVTSYLARGGAILDVRLQENEAGLWSIWVRLADRPGEFRVNHFHKDEAKTYVDITLAVATLRKEFGYYGAITLTTDRRPPPKA